VRIALLKPLFAKRVPWLLFLGRPEIRLAEYFPTEMNVTAPHTMPPHRTIESLSIALQMDVER